jgi:hypothetical protein
MKRPTAERFGSPLVTSQLHSRFTQRASKLEREWEWDREKARERERERHTHTHTHTHIHTHTQTATAWPLSSKHPYTTDLWRGEGNRELRLFVAKQRMTQHRIVTRCTNSSQGLERYSHITVGRLLQPFAFLDFSSRTPLVAICTTSLTFNNSTFCPHSVFMCSVWIWEQTAIVWNCPRI